MHIVRHDIAAIAFTVAAVWFASGAAQAQAPRQPVGPAAAGPYAWIDGSYQAIQLPTFSLGFRTINPGNTTNRARETYDPRATGHGFSGAIGYVFANPLLPFGTNTRVELGGSYVRADASGASSTLTTDNMLLVMLTGLGTNSTICLTTCATTSTLSSEYSAWQVNLKGATDFQWGIVTITPWISPFAGRAEIQQDFSQRWSDAGLPGPFNITRYTAHSSIEWTDWGARLGLDGAVALTPWLTVGVGGSVGLAQRDVEMAANDHCAHPGQCFRDRSAVATSGDVTAVLANVEARLTVRPTRMLTVRTFAGLNYDSHVPGLTQPTFSGFLGGTFVPGAPAGLKFEAQTSSYFGAGLTLAFAP